MQQRRDGCSSCTLDHEFAVRHDPDHGIEDLAVRERDDVVHKALHDRKCVIAHALHPQAVYDAVDRVDRDDAAGCDALLHRWTIGRFHANDLDLWVRRFQRHRHAGDQSAAADRHHGDIDSGTIPEHFQAQRSLARDELHVVKRMDVGKPALLTQLFGLLVGFVPDCAVCLGEGSDEYKKPQEFFRRTYLTESLKRLLVGGVKRVLGKGGDPVVQLQTNFGGGKTHSMLALYHLFSGAKASELAGVDAVLAAAGVKSLPQVKCVVLVGNKISPGNPVAKPDGTVVRTLWGELAYQLGATKAFARVKADDEKATSPGDVLRELFKEYGPCLVLVDEWVAYARQLHEQSDLPAGSFETQFSFAQALTESAKNVGNCLLVISLPASDTQG